MRAERKRIGFDRKEKEQNTKIPWTTQNDDQTPPINNRSSPNVFFLQLSVENKTLNEYIINFCKHYVL